MLLSLLFLHFVRIKCKKYNSNSIPIRRYLADRYKKWIGFLCLFIYFWLVLVFDAYRWKARKSFAAENSIIINPFYFILARTLIFWPICSNLDFFTTLTLQRKKLKTKKKTQLIIASIFRNGGPTQGRTGNTRIFSPLLYLLSYRAII